MMSMTAAKRRGRLHAKSSGSVDCEPIKNGLPAKRLLYRPLLPPQKIPQNLSLRLRREGIPIELRKLSVAGHIL